MRKKIFIIIFVAIAALCVFNAEKVYTESLKCQKGFIKIDGWLCKNNTTSISYWYPEETDTYVSYALNGVHCGMDCNFDGTNCKRGHCDKNELTKYGYIIKDNRFYNSKTNLSFNGVNFYLNGVLCGENCDIDGRNCEKGVCIEDACANEYKKLGILTTKHQGLEAGIVPYIYDINYVVCYNNSKYYNVFEPNIKKSATLKNIKRVNN